MRLAGLLIMLATAAACFGAFWIGGAALAQGYQSYPTGQPQPDGGYRNQSGGPGMNGYSVAPSGMYPQGYAPSVYGNQYPPGSQFAGQVPGQMPGGGISGRGGGALPRTMTLAQWFNAYDRIRHQAQMSTSERQRADGLLSRGLSVLMPGDEKAATNALLASMVRRYQSACNQLRVLPQLNQTANLHHAYYDYFATAGQLFADYIRVQNNLFVTDAQTGQPLASSLIQRKQMLASLEHQCKLLDAQTRAQYGIAPYPW